MILRKKKKKGVKLNYHYQKRHSIYIVVGIIMLILLTFLVNNFGNCKIYSLSINDKDFVSNNGLLVLTKDKVILKLSDIDYKGKISNIKNLDLILCVDVDDDCKQIYKSSLKASETISFRESLNEIIIDIYSNTKDSDVFTRKVRREINDNLKLVISVTTEEGNNIYTNVPVVSREEYANNKLF